MTIRELIAELAQWPPDGEVMIQSAPLPPSGIGAVAVYPLRSVRGVAGARLDGRDSGITLSPDFTACTTDKREESAADLLDQIRANAVRALEPAVSLGLGPYGTLEGIVSEIDDWKRAEKEDE